MLYYYIIDVILFVKMIFNDFLMFYITALLRISVYRTSCLFKTFFFSFLKFMCQIKLTA